MLAYIQLMAFVVLMQVNVSSITSAGKNIIAILAAIFVVVLVVASFLKAIPMVLSGKESEIETGKHFLMAAGFAIVIVILMAGAVLTGLAESVFGINLPT
jgi:hypothetical protein